MDLTRKYKEPDLLAHLFNLPETLQHILASKNLKSIEDVLKTSNIDLISFELTPDQVELLKSSVSQRVASATFLTVLEYSSILATKWRHITFGCSALDRITQNGLPIRGITEIVGEAGCGKSQLCFQLSLNVQLPVAAGGLNKSAVYICTEDAFPSKRLVQIAEFYRKQFRKDTWLDNIFIEQCANTENLMSCVFSRLPKLMTQHSIGLIIIDSIAGVFRLESDAVTRADNMRRLALTLQALADEHECAVVCINQITAPMSDNMRNKCVPCLGLAWSNLVTTQFKIRKLDKQVSSLIGSSISNSPIRVRSFEVAFSPELANQFAEFIITEKGISDIPK